MHLHSCPSFDSPRMENHDVILFLIFFSECYVGGVPPDFSSEEETSRTPLRPESTPSYPKSFEYDYIGLPEKQIVVFIADELYLDATNKIHQVESMTHLYKKIVQVPFEIGVIIGLIRGQYRRMMEHYRETQDRKKENKSYIYGPYNWYGYLTEHYLVQFEWIHQLEIDIENHIEMLESIPADKIREFDEFINQPRDQPMPSVLRRTNDKVLKNRMKKNYIARKLKERSEGARFDDFEFKGSVFETYLPDEDIWYMMDEDDNHTERKP